MQDRQRVNVDWMKGVMARHNLNAAEWARRAKSVAEAAGQSCTLTGPTITKAMKEEYPFVTKAVTLEQLAAAVGETPPTDTAPDDMVSAIPLPTVDALEAMIRTYLESIGPGRPTATLTADLAGRMHESLASLQGDPAAARIPEAARSAALQINRTRDQ